MSGSPLAVRRRYKTVVRVILRSRQSLSTLSSALHNPDIRRIEIVWAVAIGAEWADFVALGVFAYHHGGTAFVGLAGLVRLLPAGVLAPFASSLGDRLPRGGCSSFCSCSKRPLSVHPERRHWPAAVSRCSCWRR